MSSSNSRGASLSQQFATSSSRWAALQRRDPAAENSFIYSVITTKIYCRPTCPSRLARRANVVFHNTAADAEEDGFRPCRRCRPDLKSDEVPQRKAIEKACDLIKGELFIETEMKKWTVKALAKEVGLTESHFCRSFKRVMKCTIGEYRIKVTSVTPNNDGVNIGDLNLSLPIADQHLDASESDSIVVGNQDVPLADATGMAPFDFSTYIWDNYNDWNQDVTIDDWMLTDMGTFDYPSISLSLSPEGDPALDGEKKTAHLDWGLLGL